MVFGFSKKRRPGMDSPSTRVEAPPRRDQNFTIKCDDADAGKMYQTAWEGSSSNMTQICSPTEVDKDCAGGRIDEYDLLGSGWPPADWVLLDSTTCEGDFGPCVGRSV